MEEIVWALTTDEWWKMAIRPMSPEEEQRVRIFPKEVQIMAAKEQPTDTPLSAELADKLKQIGYPDFAIAAGEEQIPMLHIMGNLIGSVEYVLSLSDNDLKALIDETVGV